MRVISGEARGHTLKAPKGMTTRPMADKIKGAVFSMLSNILEQLDREWGRVLDLYAGSGSIGIEALSRGASWVDFVEINAGVCRVIADNLEHTKFTSRARVNNRAVHAFFAHAAVFSWFKSNQTSRRRAAPAQGRPRTQPGKSRFAPGRADSGRPGCT